MRVLCSYFKVMVFCNDCGMSFQRKHTCRAGTCPDCKSSFKQIDLHKCPVQKVLQVPIEDACHDLKTRGPTCDGCGAHHLMTKNIHGFRMFCGAHLCYDCYHIPEIQAHTAYGMQKLLHYEILRGKTQCALCDRTLIDPVTGHALCAFERDHVDVFTKSCSVWELVSSGAPWPKIRHESDKCRNVCVKCHSIITAAQRRVGILGLKNLVGVMDPEIKLQAESTVDVLVAKLNDKKSCSSM